MLLKILIAAAVVLALVMLLRLTRGGSAAAGPVRRVLSAVGPARCLAAVQAVNQLAREADQAVTLQAWNAIELPLLQALPDCPPNAKPALMNALDALAKVTSNRELAKRMMTLRNGLVG